MQKLLELKAKYKDLTGVDIAGGSKRDKKSGGNDGGAGEKGKGGGKQKGGGGDADKGKKATKDADAAREVKKVTRWVLISNFY